MSRFKNLLKPEEEPTQVLTGMASSTQSGNLDDRAKELLVALRSPEAGNAADGGATTGGVPSGYYSPYMSYVKVGVRKLYGRKVGGRFFYPDSELSGSLVTLFDALVERGVMYHESDDATE